MIALHQPRQLSSQTQQQHSWRCCLQAVPVVAALPAEGCVHVKVVAGGDLDAVDLLLKAPRPGPEHSPVVLLPLLADHPSGHVTHLMRQRGAQPGLVVDHLQQRWNTHGSMHSQHRDVL